MESQGKKCWVIARGKNMCCKKFRPLSLHRWHAHKTKTETVRHSWESCCQKEPQWKFWNPPKPIRNPRKCAVELVKNVKGARAVWFGQICANFVAWAETVPLDIPWKILESLISGCLKDCEYKRSREPLLYQNPTVKRIRAIPPCTKKDYLQCISYEG